MVMIACRGPRQSLLARQVSQIIKESHMTLDELQAETSINRAKLGRMRLGTAPVSFDEAEVIFRATKCPSRAMVTLACLGEDRILTPEALAYLDHFLGALPSLLDQLNGLGETLNPKWAHGSAHHIGTLMTEHAARLLQAEAFTAPAMRAG
jgi:hypothetical protein